MNYNVPQEWLIVIHKKSTTKTLNNYEKNAVIDALYDCLNKGLATDANYWAGELFASGFYLQLWDALFAFYFQSIHYLNVNVIAYLNEKYELFNQIKKSYTGNLKNLCNNQELRNHLAELITILCMCKKQKLIINPNLSVYEIDIEMVIKTDKVIYLIAPYLSSESLVYQQFRSFIINYYYDDVDNCMYYIDWFIKDNEYAITPFNDFSLPAGINSKSIWLVWKFILLQHKTLKNTMNNEDEYKQMIDLVELLIHLFLIIFKRKDLNTCVYMLTMMIFIVKCPSAVNWSKMINSNSHHVIKQCANINFIYNNLQKSHNQMIENGANQKKGRTTKKDLEKQKFYDNDKNQNFVTLLNDSDAMISNNVGKPQSETHESDSDSDTIETGPQMDENFVLSIQVPANKSRGRKKTIKFTQKNEDEDNEDNNLTLDEDD